MSKEEIIFPVNPLNKVINNEEIQRRTVAGVLESYNSNYDVLAEMVQNSVDAVEDAFLSDLPAPYIIEVHINLQKNSISVLDTGIGMNREQAVEAFVPSISFKHNSEIKNKRVKNSYRGYKGVGLTFLAYGTDDITIHTKTEGNEITKGRMQYARTWAKDEKNEAALIVEDTTESPLDKYSRGTYMKVQLTTNTRPKKLSAISANSEGWKSVLRTRTALGQINFSGNPLTDIKASLVFTDTDGNVSKDTITSKFLFPHLVTKTPDFRFLDIPNYYEIHGERSDIPVTYQRQDGIYLVWDKDRIFEELTKDQKEKYQDEIAQYNPKLYAFFPYSNVIWQQINKEIGGWDKRRHLSPGLVIGVNRQRLADTIKIEATRFTNLAPSLFVLVHFIGAKPDQGRKTLQDEVMDLAKDSADRAFQYLMKQQNFLKPRGDAPTPDQREIEKNHEDWIYNVKKHADNSPLIIPLLTYKSEPLQEQDVIGLFHQLSAHNIFPGIQVFATSQIKTYDSLVKFECSVGNKNLRYHSVDENPLGVSDYILGEKANFSTRYLTLEYKNNLDGLIGDLVGKADPTKDFSHVDICVCWRVVADKFPGFTLEEINNENIEERRYPGTTHLLRRDGDRHVIQVIMLERVVEMIKTGQIKIED